MTPNKETILLLKGWQKSVPPKDGKSYMCCFHNNDETCIVCWDKKRRAWSDIVTDVVYSEPEYWREMNNIELVDFAARIANWLFSNGF
jgi:hypothetical protein